MRAARSAAGTQNPSETSNPNEMPETSAQHGRSFDENIEILFDEIVLAAQWQRPSLLLAVQKSKFGQEKAENELEGQLEQQGFQVERIVINDQRADIAQLIRESAPGPNPVYFISNIDWGGGVDGREAYRALNLHRELFVEEAIRAVFWLSVNEAANLPRFAPDFWAFRHRVVEFISQRAPAKVQLPAGILAWDIMRSPDPFESAEAGIQAREELLRKLPDSLEALSTKVEIHASLGHLHWSQGELGRARQEFQTGLALAKGYELPELNASTLNGLGIIEYEGGHPAAASEKFNEGLKYRSSSRVLLINLSASHCVLGQIQEALTLGKRAVRASPSDADTWRRLGYIHNAAGRPDEAISHLAKAAELAPRSVEPRIGLAVMYSLIDRPEDARIQMQRARELAGGEGNTYLDILREACIGDAEKAAAMLREAVAGGKMKKLELQRDPNLCLVMDPGGLKDLAG